MSNPENYDQTIIDAVVAARDAASVVLKERGYETLHEGKVIHNAIHDDIMWAFIRVWGGHVFSPFLKLIDFEGLFYPEDSGEFTGQTIPQQVADLIIQKATALLEADNNEGNTLSEKMREHLTSIVESGMPYGVKVVAVE